MSITFENEADVLFCIFAKLLITFEQHHYLLAARSVWWIVELVQLDPVLRYFLACQNYPSEDTNMNEWQAMLLEVTGRDISLTPQDCYRSSQISIINTVFIKSKYSRLFKSSSYPKTQPLILFL